jgi:membrane fusion protein (multidrug efflux system)
MQYQRAAVLAMIAAISLTGCGKGGGQRGPMPLNVDVATAQRRDISTSISLDGQIAPLQQSTLSFQQSGAITDVYVNVGDRVSQGQVLAKIDDSVLRAQYAQAAAQAQGAALGLPVQSQQNSAAVTTARAALNNAKLQAQNAYQNAQVGLQSTSVTAEQVKAAQAAAHTLATQIGQTTLYAPYSGVITQRLLDPGAFAGPQAPVLAISRIDTVWVNINVPDEDLSYVHSGTGVRFTSSSLPGKTFAANISTVNAVPTTGTLSYLARIQMQNPGDLLRGGMLVTATITKEARNNTIVVPRSAVAQTENGNAVYVVTADNKAKEVPVRVGIQTDTLSEVLSPEVQAGTKVITTRPDALKDGSVVAVNGETPPNPTAGATSK